MKNEKEYEKHIKESWTFSTNTANETNADMKSKLALLIFEKTCSPYHYFMQNNETTTDEKPTEKQISYAEKLGISDPQSYTKKTLSDKIDEVVKNGS